MKRLLTIFMCFLAIGCGAKEPSESNKKEEPETQEKNEISTYNAKLLDVNFGVSLGGRIFSWDDKLALVKLVLTMPVQSVVRYEYNDETIEFAAFVTNLVSDEKFVFQTEGSEEYKGWYIISSEHAFYAAKPFKVGASLAFIELGSTDNTSATIDGKKFVYSVIDSIEEENIDYLGQGLIIREEIDLLGNGTLYLGTDNTTINAAGENVPVVYSAYLKSETDSECTRLDSSKGFYIMNDDAIVIQECYPYGDVDIKKRMEELMKKEWEFSGKVKYGKIEADSYFAIGSEGTYSFVIYTEDNTGILLVPTPTSKYYVSDNEYHLSSKEEVFKYMLEDHFIVKK